MTCARSAICILWKLWDTASFWRKPRSDPVDLPSLNLCFCTYICYLNFTSEKKICWQWIIIEIFFVYLLFPASDIISVVCVTIVVNDPHCSRNVCRVMTTEVNRCHLAKPKTLSVSDMFTLQLYPHFYLKYTYCWKSVIITERVSVLRCITT